MCLIEKRIYIFGDGHKEVYEHVKSFCILSYDGQTCPSTQREERVLHAAGHSLRSPGVDHIPDLSSTSPVSDSFPSTSPYDAAVVEVQSTNPSSNKDHRYIEPFELNPSWGNSGRKNSQQKGKEKHNSHKLHYNWGTSLTSASASDPIYIVDPPSPILSTVAETGFRLSTTTLPPLLPPFPPPFPPPLIPPTRLRDNPRDDGFELLEMPQFPPSRGPPRNFPPEAASFYADNDEPSQQRQRYTPKHKLQPVSMTGPHKYDRPPSPPPFPIKLAIQQRKKQQEDKDSMLAETNYASDVTDSDLEDIEAYFEHKDRERHESFQEREHQRQENKAELARAITEALQQQQEQETTCRPATNMKTSNHAGQRYLREEETHQVAPAVFAAVVEKSHQNLQQQQQQQQQDQERLEQKLRLHQQKQQQKQESEPEQEQEQEREQREQREQEACLRQQKPQQQQHRWMQEPRHSLSVATSWDTSLLIEKTGARQWIAYALEKHTAEVIEGYVATALRDYSAELRPLAIVFGIRREKPVYEDSTTVNSRKALSNFIQENRFKIAKDFLKKAISSTPSPVPVENDLSSQKSFTRLAAIIRRRFHYNDGDVLTTIRDIVSRGLVKHLPDKTLESPETGSCMDHKYIHSTSFEVQWNPIEFFVFHYGSNSAPIGDVLTLSGCALEAYATTCSDYLQTIWPLSGTILLQALQSALDKGMSRGDLPHATVSQNNIVIDVSLMHNLYEQFDQDCIFITARGTGPMIVELAQQICWLSAALRLSNPGQNIVCCTPYISSGTSPQHFPQFYVDFDPTPLAPTETSCWVKLFDRAVMACGFPVPKRRSELGLEIPIKIMAEIAGVRHAVEYEGGVVLKGFSSIFIPIRRENDRVQWHLVSNDDHTRRLSYRDVLRTFGERAMIHELSLDALGTTRAIVGWCTAVDLSLGSESADYENLDYSGAEDAENGLKFAGGALGFQQFGVAQLNFVLGARDGKCHFRRSGPYRNIISAAEQTPLVLYDTREKRAWLVPSSSIVLHIAQHRHWKEPFEPNGKPIQLVSAETAQFPVREILLKNACRQLDEGYTFKDLVLDIWSLLEFLVDQNIHRESAPGISVKGTLRDAIQGFDFKAVVDQRSPYHLKHSYVEKSHGGWTDLIKDVDALVLFADGFGDVIRPSSNASGLCYKWKSVPKGKDYLATTVKVLVDLYDAAGCRCDREFLSRSSKGLKWHKGSSGLWDPCPRPKSHNCQCNRLQQIVPKSAIGHVVPPGPLIDEGAVIFGQSGTLLSNLTTGQHSQSAPFYSQPNNNITFLPARHETQGLKSAPSETSSQASDISEPLVLMPSSMTSLCSKDNIKYVGSDSFSEKDISNSEIDLQNSIAPTSAYRLVSSVTCDSLYTQTVCWNNGSTSSSSSRS